MKATVRKVRTLTGGILYPKLVGFHPQRIFPGGFPNFPTIFHNFPVTSPNFSLADIILAAVQTTANLPALKLRGWTDTEIQAFTTVRNTFPASTTVQQSGEIAAIKATAVKTSDAAAAYDHLLTIQNAADLEFPATNPANAPTRTEFRLGLFPPTHHTPDVAPMPTPATPAPTPATPPAN